MKAWDEVGLARLVRHGGWRGFDALLRSVPTPFLRRALLRAAGAEIGPDTILMPGLRLENLDRHRGPGALRIGRDCFVSYDVHLDLAGDVTIGDQVSIGPRTVVMTHLSVGYADHPLQDRFPRETAPVTVGPGSFLAAGVIVLPGTRLGPETFVAAGSVVRGEHPGRELLAGTPAKRLRSWEGGDGQARKGQTHGTSPHFGHPSA